MAQDIGDGIAIRKRRQWSSVPDDVLEDTRISLRARAVLGWMLGRPVGWTLYVRHMRRVLNMSEHVWVSIRTELEAAGYYSQTRGQDATGRIIWQREITDTPVSPSPNLSRMDVAMDGFAIHGNVGDIPISLEHDHLNPPQPPRPSREPDQPAGTGSGGGDQAASPEGLSPKLQQAIEDEEMGRREAISRGEAPKVGNWGAWRAKLVERVRAGKDITSEHGLRVARRREAEARLAQARERSRATIASGVPETGRSSPPLGWSGPVPVNVRSEAG
jgi:hypothetical protein